MEYYLRSFWYFLFTMTGVKTLYILYVYKLIHNVKVIKNALYKYVFYSKMYILMLTHLCLKLYYKDITTLKCS